MRASNEVTVNRKELLAAVTRIPRGGLRKRGQHAPRSTLIYAEPPMLIVETPYVRTEVTATGAWEQPVAVNARLLIMITRKLPKTECVTLLYVNGRLFFERLSIDATPAAGMTRTKSGRLSAMPGSTPTPQRSASPVPVRDGQLLMAGFAPVTDRERLEQRAKAPMGPRRR